MVGLQWAVRMKHLAIFIKSCCILNMATGGGGSAPLSAVLHSFFIDSQARKWMLIPTDCRRNLSSQILSPLWLYIKILIAQLSSSAAPYCS